MNPYADDKGVPFNRLGITDPAELKLTEYDITTMQTHELKMQPIAGNYDLAHMQKIHERIFSEVYDYAGKVRTMNINKSDPSQLAWKTRFAPEDQIPKLANDIAQEIKDKNGLKGLDKAQFVDGITSVYVKINYMHPFPEGNGRTTQVLLSQLAKEAGHELDFNKVEKQTWNSAAARSAPQQHYREPGFSRAGDPAQIRAVFERILVEPKRDISAERPARAVAFEQLPHDQAIKKHPELTGAVRELDARAAAIKASSADPVVQVQDVAQARADIQGRLDAGKIPALPAQTYVRSAQDLPKSR